MEKQISIRTFGVMKFNIFIIQEVMKRRTNQNQAYMDNLEKLSETLEHYLVKWMGENHMRRSFKERNNPFCIELNEVKSAFIIIYDKFSKCDAVMWESTPTFTPEYPLNVVAIHEEMKASFEQYRKRIDEIERGTP